LSIKFDYPPTGPTETVTLPSPQLGDSVQHEQTINFHRTMSGKLFSYKRTPEHRIFLWNIIAISDDLISDFRDFYITANGKEIRITDHNDNEWDGYFMNDPFEDIDNGTCKNEVTIQFIGKAA
jgi:hypothetical protein